MAKRKGDWGRIWCVIINEKNVIDVFFVKVKFENVFKKTQISVGLERV